MIKPVDVLAKMLQIEGPGQLELAPGPFSIDCNVQDARAAELLLWVMKRWPNLKVGELLSMLNAAIWWSTFFAAAMKAAPTPKRNEFVGGLPPLDGFSD